MSEPNRPAEGAPEGAVQPLNGEGQSSGEREPKTFSAEYVSKLRDEAAGYRIKAARADDLAEALYESTRQLATAGVLRDPADLPDGDYDDPETGRSDLHKMREAAEQVAQAKPHLALPRVPRQQLQGPTDAPEQTAGLGAMLREAAR